MICTDGIIFMSMFNDIDWKERKRWDLYSNFEQVKNYAKRFSQGHWTFLGLGDEKKWYGTLPYTPERTWNSIASQMVQRLKEPSHPVFMSANFLSRGIYKERKTIHFNADASNTELLFRGHSFCKSAQYLRSSLDLVWTLRPDRGRKSTTKTSWKGRIRDQRCIEKREVTRTTPFRIFSKTSIWKQFARKHSGLRITDRNNSISTGMNCTTRPD